MLTISRKSLATVAFAAVLASAAPAHAATTPATPAPSAAAKAVKAEPHFRHMNVETRIADLHRKLDITKAQEADWKAVADTMRADAKTVHELIEARRKNADTMTAVDDLNSYAKIAEAHADGIQKLVPVFTKLYDSMTPEQKKNADKVFGGFEGRHEMHKPAPAKK
ncbi:MAG: Spy/CpxP family protein refolding chaperone [Alphaproteobacteria bacterium]|nr:Spy/CpxP family protein refolding chaperone [Alphaproteobacteria bacterium]